MMEYMKSEDGEFVVEKGRKVIWMSVWIGEGLCCFDLHETRS